MSKIKNKSPNKNNKKEKILKPVKTKKFLTSTYVRGTEFIPPEYDLRLIQQILDIETYFSRSIIKKISVILKEGYEFKSENNESIEYIKRRFNEIEYVSGIPLRLFIKEIIENNLLPFSNCFIAKIRSAKSSTGKKWVDIDGRTREPIAAFKILPAPNVQVLTTKTGKIKKYIVIVNGEKIEEYTPKDVYHFYMSKKTGFLYGTPEIVPIIDDILSLRRIEENVETIVYRHAVPIGVCTVGTESAPAKVSSVNGESELEFAKYVIEKTEPGSALIFPERYKFEIIGSKGSALDVTSYLTHFKKRIFAGLSMSAYDFGETDSSNKSSASGLSKDFIDYCKNIQQTFETFFNSFIINELMLEWQKPSFVFSEKNKIELKFNEIDPDRQTRETNAIVQLVLGNICTISEGRKMLGLDEQYNEKELLTYVTNKVTYNENSANGTSKSNVNPSNQYTKDSIYISYNDFNNLDMCDMTKKILNNYNIDSNIAESAINVIYNNIKDMKVDDNIKDDLFNLHINNIIKQLSQRK